MTDRKLSESNFATLGHIEGLLEAFVDYGNNPQWKEDFDKLDSSTNNRIVQLRQVLSPGWLVEQTYNGLASTKDLIEFLETINWRFE